MRRSLDLVTLSIHNNSMLIKHVVWPAICVGPARQNKIARRVTGLSYAVRCLSYYCLCLPRFRFWAIAVTKCCGLLRNVTCGRFARVPEARAPVIAAVVLVVAAVIV